MLLTNTIVYFTTYSLPIIIFRLGGRRSGDPTPSDYETNSIAGKSGTTNISDGDDIDYARIAQLMRQVQIYLFFFI